MAVSHRVMAAAYGPQALARPSLGSVYAWETVEGVTGSILIDPEESVARPCTPEGTTLGDMLLDKKVGNVENPDPDPKLRRAFLIAASLIFQEGERQGRLPDEITRTYW